MNHGMKHLLQLLLPAVLLTGCTADDGTCWDDVITYDVTTDDALTRGGTPMTADNFATSGQQFRLWAWMYHDGKTPVPMTTEFNTDPLSNVLVTYSSGAWTTASKYYWPQQSYNVDFCAVYPITADFSATNRTVAFTASAPVSGADDLMVAYTTAKRNQTATQKQSVTLPFKHMLTQVAFHGVLGNTFQEQGWNVTVSAITLHNINGAGTLDCTTGTFTPNATSPSLQSYPLTMTSSSVAVSATETALTSLTSLPMLMPQERDAWNQATEDISTTTGAYITLSCRMWNPTTFEYLVGTASSDGTVNVPVAIDWTAGKRYVYTIHFDTASLTVSAAIQPWTQVQVNGLTAE